MAAQKLASTRGWLQSGKGSQEGARPGQRFQKKKSLKGPRIKERTLRGGASSSHPGGEGMEIADQGRKPGGQLRRNYNLKKLLLPAVIKNAPVSKIMGKNVQQKISGGLKKRKDSVKKRVE